MQDEPDALSVEVRLEERNWYKVHAATYVQGGESTFEVTAGLHNATGRCEHLVGNVEYGTENSHTAALSYEQPRALGLPVRVRALPTVPLIAICPFTEWAYDNDCQGSTHVRMPLRYAITPMCMCLWMGQLLLLHGRRVCEGMLPC